MRNLIFMLIATFVIFAAYPAAANASEWTWADDIKWMPGDGTNPGAERYLIDEALGEPDAGRSGYDFLSLGLGGFAIVDFGSHFKEIAITYETTWSSGSSYYETASLYAAGDGFDFDSLLTDANGVLLDDLSLDDLYAYFTYLGDVDNVASDGTATLDIDGVYRYLLIVDTTPSSSPSYDGFDVDAVGVHHAPIPGAVWLLGSGLIGVVCLRKRFTS